MTPEQFEQLSPSSQESYLESGGTIESAQAPSVEPIPIVNDVSSPVTSLLEPERESAELNQQTPASAFDIKNPVELLFLFDEAISSGAVKLHKWQIQIMLDFANDKNTKDFPLIAEIRACNGSGKDKYVVAACAVWLCMAYEYARVIATNGSGVQLDNQTETYVEQLCQMINRKFGALIWKCNYRYYECLPTHSPINLFATDEPNKAEGYHPLIPGGKMAIFASEAKAIPDSIFTALTRCTGFTHRVDVSTPGLPMGYFFDRCTTSIQRQGISGIKDINPTDSIEYHITAFDCPHITASEIEQMRKSFPGGENGSAYKSAVMAEFGTTDEMVVIPYIHIWKSKAPSLPWFKEPFNTGGLDLSAGGDETSLTIRNGNKRIKTIGFKFDNTQDTIEHLEQLFREYGLDNPKAKIFADAGGLGKPIIDQLRKRGWSNIYYVVNQGKPIDDRVYVNRGAEMWFHFGKLLERHEIHLGADDDLLITQLSSRFYKITEKNKHQLESKLQARAKGHPSPDRADGCILAFCNYKSQLDDLSVVEENKKPFLPEKTEEKRHKPFLLKRWAEDGNDHLSKYIPQRRQRDFSRVAKLVEQHNQLITKQ